MTRTFSLLVAIGMILLVPFFAGALQNGQPTDSSEKLKELITQRRDVLNQRLKILTSQYDVGEIQLTPVLIAHNQVLEAELELAADKKGRVKLLQRRIDVMQLMENNAKSRFKSGVSSNEAWLAAKAARLQAEIDLVREEN